MGVSRLEWADPELTDWNPDWETIDHHLLGGEAEGMGLLVG